MAKRAIINYFIDIGLAVTFLLAFITGIFKWPSLVRWFGWSASSYRVMTFIHDWSGLIMSLLVLVHIILHWRWIVVMSRKIFKKKHGGIKR